MIIYEAINKSNGKRYIGRTIHSLEYLMRQHLSSVNNSGSGCTSFRKAIKECGGDAFEWKIIDRADSIKELDEKESFWIQFFNTTDERNGYNLKGGAANPFLTERTKAAIGNAQRGLLNHMYGKRGKDNPASIPIIDITTEERYDSASSFCRENPSFDVSKVCAVCRGERYTYKSHIFRYINEDGSIKDNGVPTNMDDIREIKSNNVSKNPTSLPIEDTTNHIIYRSITEAVGKRYKRCLCRKLKSEGRECDYHGIHWKLL